MTPTSVSLLDRLKAAGPDASDWNRLQGIYLPLISRWLGRVPGVGEEADDLAQEVFLVVIRGDPPLSSAQREGIVPRVAAASDGEQGPGTHRRRAGGTAAGPSVSTRPTVSSTVWRTPAATSRVNGTWTTTAMSSRRSYWRSCSPRLRVPRRRGKRSVVSPVDWKPCRLALKWPKK